jgi:uncharacterized membrane protein YbhN (UPF0104 family)
VIGFLVVTVPGGLGVRELLLQQFLSAKLALVFGVQEATATALTGALILRLVWVLAELAAAATLYWIPILNDEE